MDKLLKIEINENQEPVISGRMLHDFLEINSNYTTWFNRILEYGFKENSDYMVIWCDSKNGNAVEYLGSSQKMSANGYYIDHVVKLDMAKEIAMIQRNEKGKIARQYFIDVEKDWNSPEKVMARAIIIANNKILIQEQQIKTLEIQNEVQRNQITEMTPKVNYHDNVLNKGDLLTTTVIAKDLGLNSASALNKILLRNKIIYKDKSGTWNPYSNYEWLIKENYCDYKSYEDKKAKPCLKWTEKGRKWIMENFSEWKEKYA